MALQNVLSAIRTLVLDVDSLPESVFDRELRYREWFPKLAPEELEDLAKIPVEKLGIYTSTIFAGESGIIKNHFRITLACLIPAWEAVNNEPFKYVPFTKRVHKARPWNSYKTLNFIHSVRDAICFDMPELLQHSPELADLARMEATGVEIKRLPDVAKNPAALDLTAIQALTVNELLELTATVTPTTRTLSASHPVFSTFIAFHRDKQSPALPLNKSPSFGIATRTTSNILRWKEVPAGVLSLVEKQNSFSVELFANEYANLETDKSEEVLFQFFIQDLTSLVKNGAIELSA